MVEREFGTGAPIFCAKSIKASGDSEGFGDSFYF